MATQQPRFGVVTDPEILKKLAEYRGVWVYAEVDDNQLTNVSLELLAAARYVAQKTKEDVSAVLVGYGIERFTRDLIAHGADRVYPSSSWRRSRPYFCSEPTEMPAT